MSIECVPDYVLHVFVERYVSNEYNGNALYAEFIGEYVVPIGSYLDVCDQIAKGIGLDENRHSIIYGTNVPQRY